MLITGCAGIAGQCSGLTVAVGYPGVICQQSPKEHVQEENSERNTEIVLLSSQGMTHSAIAERFGITRQRVGAIVTRYSPQQTERSRQLKEKYADLQKVVNFPPAKTTAIGRTVTDPDSGETVRDMSVYVSAVREQRLLTAEMRREEREQRDNELSEEEEQRLMAEVLSWFEQVTSDNRRLTLEVVSLRSRLAAYEDGEVVEAELVPTWADLGEELGGELH